MVVLNERERIIVQIEKFTGELLSVDYDLIDIEDLLKILAALKKGG